MSHRVEVAGGFVPEECDDQEGDGLVHVYPCFGREHVVSYDCWCHPRLDWDGGVPIVVHTVHH